MRIEHSRRPDTALRHPIHVTWRVRPGVPNLRRNPFVSEIRRAIARSQKAGFRIIEYSIMTNHLHFIIEARSKQALAAGMSGLAKRLALRLNPLFEHAGKLFADRYHARILKTPREVRNALRYVLLNERHHAHDVHRRLDKRWVDPCTSGLWFDGWARPVVLDSEWKRELVQEGAGTVPASSWLLRVGWRQWGLIAFDEIPGRLPRQRGR